VSFGIEFTRSIFLPMPIAFYTVDLQMNIYVGNLPYSMNDGELEELFDEFGSVQSAKVIMDRETNRSKGFGFVIMDNDEEANTAISNLNGHSLKGRELRVNEARPREERPRPNRW